MLFKCRCNYIISNRHERVGYGFLGDHRWMRAYPYDALSLFRKRTLETFNHRSIACLVMRVVIVVIVGRTSRLMGCFGVSSSERVAKARVTWRAVIDWHPGRLSRRKLLEEFVYE